MVSYKDNDNRGFSDHGEILDGRRPASDARLLESVRGAAPMMTSGEHEQHTRAIDESVTDSEAAEIWSCRSQPGASALHAVAGSPVK